MGNIEFFQNSGLRKFNEERIERKIGEIPQKTAITFNI
jgi:hypothetical protein